MSFFGLGGGSKAPAAPDPVATAQAQAAANADTARLSAKLNRVNEVTPFGTLTYSQGGPDKQTWIDQQVAAHKAAFDQGGGRGEWWVKPGGGSGSVRVGPDGFLEEVPGGAGGYTFDEAGLRNYFAKQNPPESDNWTVTQKLSPEQQALYDLQTKAQTTYGQIGNAQLEAVRGALSVPDTTDYSQARKDALAAQMARLAPQYAQQEQTMRAHLLNSGLTEGSEGWNRAFQQFNQGRNDALIAADLNAGNTVGQQIAQQTALRARPLNEASVLLTGGQVQVPQLMNTPGVNVAPTDVVGPTNTAYQGQLAQWQNSQNNAAAGLGGLFGLAGTLGGAYLGGPWGAAIGGKLGSTVGSGLAKGF